MLIILVQNEKLQVQIRIIKIFRKCIASVKMFNILFVKLNDTNYIVSGLNNFVFYSIKAMIAM